MTIYYRVMLGKGSMYAQECFAGNYIGIKAYSGGSDENLTNLLPEDWHEFNEWFIPAFQKIHPEKSKISAGLAGGYVWNICKGIRVGDYVLSPDGTGSYRIAEVTSEYYFAPSQDLAHCRSVRWLSISIEKSRMSELLKNSLGSVGTVINVSGYSDEIEKLIGPNAPAVPAVNIDPIEDPYAFALEKHLEDFLVQNWTQTELGKDYSIYSEDGETVGQQYQTDIGIIDILAIKKDKSELLVVELKKGKASDVVVGQTLRYMGYVKSELAEAGQTIKGIIIALEDDSRLQYALSVIPNVEFYRYKIDFKLMKAI